MNAEQGVRLGHRVARRREELGLTTEELAVKARVTVEYLRHLEHDAALVSGETLVRLARALEISGWVLLGEDSAWPDAKPSPAVMEELGAVECRRLLALGGVGRVIAGTAAVPVNYVVYRGDIVFRTATDGGLARLAGSEIGFEIDGIDPAHSAGWSVSVAGLVSEVTDPDDIDHITRAVRPWAGEDRRLCLRVRIIEISGRRVGRAASPPTTPA